MKIALINNLYHPDKMGGSDVSVKILAEALRDQGHEPVIIATTGGLTRTDKVDGITVYRLSPHNIYWSPDAQHHSPVLKSFWHLLDIYNPGMLQGIGRILRAEKPEVIQTNCLTGFSVAVWRMAKHLKIPVVCTLRDHYLLCPKTTKYKEGSRCAVSSTETCTICDLYSLPKRRMSHTVNTVVGISQFILDQHLKRGYFESAIQYVVPNPVHIDIDRKPRKGRSPVTFLYMGLLAHMKGIEYLLDSFQPGLNAELIVAGRGKSRAFEERLQSEYAQPNISFVGFINPDEIFPKVDVLVAPSLCNEAFGRTVIEAYSQGIPVIVSNRGGLPEIVEHGKSGFIFDPAEEGTLLKFLNRFIDDPEIITQMSPYCLEKAQAFRSDNIADAYVNIYQTTLQGFPV
ncbi:glycosyltransferase family 4 protein [Candidatus Neomarinimicrobiota bacterium]